MFVDGDVATDIENTVDTENNDWLHSNQSYQPMRIGKENTILQYIYIYYCIAGYKITYSIATLSYDNYYINLRDYSNSLLSGLL